MYNPGQRKGASFLTPLRESRSPVCTRRYRRGTSALLVIATLMPVCAAISPANAADSVGAAVRTLVVSGRSVQVGPPIERGDHARPDVNWTEWLGTRSLTAGPAALEVQRVAHLHANTGSRGR